MPDDLLTEIEETEEEIKARKAETLDKVCEENKVADKVVVREGEKFVVSANVQALSREEIEEGLRFAKYDLGEYDRIVAIGHNERVLKVQDWENKLAQLV